MVYLVSAIESGQSGSGVNLRTIGEVLRNATEPDLLLNKEEL